MDISVIFSTCQRDSVLQRTLDGFCQLAAGSPSWELVIVDNACSASTAELVQSFTDRLPIIFLTEARPGKNHALLRALPEAAGDLYVFCDDDILPESDWLKQIWQGVQRWPEYDLFGGRILPAFPEGEAVDPRIVMDHEYTRSAFVIADWDLPEGPIIPEKIWGPNMAVRKRVIEAGVRFNPDIGPTAGKQYIMGSETAFLLEAHKAGFACGWLPQAVVRHQIRPEQLRLDWVVSRFVRLGRGRAALEQLHASGPPAKACFGVPRYLYRKLIELRIAAWFYRLKGEAVKYYETVINRAICKGEMIQYKHLGR